MRQVSSALALIKAPGTTEDLFLMQQSTWGGSSYFWFLGGRLEEVDDQDFERCLLRELEEELSLPRIAVREATRLFRVSDRRVSRRCNELTEYEYQMFLVLLDESHEATRDLYRREFERRTSDGRIRNNRWLTWNEIQEDKDLRRDAPTILDGLSRCGQTGLPYSLTREIAETVTDPGIRPAESSGLPPREER